MTGKKIHLILLSTFCIWVSGCAPSEVAKPYIPNLLLFSDVQSGNDVAGSFVTLNATTNGTNIDAASEGYNGLEISPENTSGLMVSFSNHNSINLSTNYQNGYLQFSIKSTNSTSLMVGILASSNWCWVNLDTNFYTNDGNWHKIAIPLSKFTNVGSSIDIAFMLTNSNSVSLDGDICLDDLFISPSKVSTRAWSLYWSDEFTNAYINTNIWKYETQDKGDYFWTNSWNNEDQYYTYCGTSNSNLYIEPGTGVLVFKAYHKSGAGYDFEDNSITSARIVTKGTKTFQYGRMAARIKMPYGNGIWPAFWMLGTTNLSWPGCGEIDIVEMVGGEQGEARNGGDDMVVGSLHGPDYYGGSSISGRYTLSPGILADDYHIYEIEWTTSGINFYFDSILYQSVVKGQGGTWVYDQPFYFILNLAIGGAWPGSADSTTVFPQTMKVDWVRVYKEQ